MPLADTLYALLATGAGLAATEAAKTLGKTAVGDAYTALKARLSSALGAKSVELIDGVPDNPALEPAIKADLARPEIAADPQVLELAEALRAAIAAIPPAEESRYAMDIRNGIRAARDITLRNVQGVRAGHIDAGQDFTAENIAAPPGKS
jgi:hypothetical protein